VKERTAPARLVKQAAHIVRVALKDFAHEEYCSGVGHARESAEGVRGKGIPTAVSVFRETEQALVVLGIAQLTP